MKIKIVFIVLVTVTFVSCNPYKLLKKSKQAEIKKDYESRVDLLKIVANNIKLNQNDTLLDIACGNGYSLSILAKFLPEDTKYYAEDIIKYVSYKKSFKFFYNFVGAKANFKNYRFIKGKKDYLPFSDNSFNQATLLISLHEFEYKEKMLSEAYRVLKQNGKLYILETVSPDSVEHRDKNCGFLYLKDSSLTNLISTTRFNILKDTIPTSLENKETYFTRLLVLVKSKK